MWIAVVPPPIPKFQKLNGFRPLYFSGALFSGLFLLFSLAGLLAPAGQWTGNAPGRPVVPLAGPWCL